MILLWRLFQKHPFAQCIVVLEIEWTILCQNISTMTHFEKLYKTNQRSDNLHSTKLDAVTKWAFSPHFSYSKETEVTFRTGYFQNRPRIFLKYLPIIDWIKQILGLLKLDILYLKIQCHKIWCKFHLKATWASWSAGLRSVRHKACISSARTGWMCSWRKSGCRLSTHNSNVLKPYSKNHSSIKVACNNNNITELGKRWSRSIKLEQYKKIMK